METLVIKNEKRGCEIEKTGNTYTSFNYASYSQRIMSIFNSSKEFKTLEGAKRFANKYINS
jgi:hypothetical protein